MRIERIDCRWLRLPSTTEVLWIALHATDGLVGHGLAAVPLAGAAMRLLAREVFAPGLLGLDPRDHERHWANALERMQPIGPAGLALQTYAAFDLALWDIKCRAARQPLGQLLGGHGDRVLAFASGPALPTASPPETLRDLRSPRWRGARGLLIELLGDDPEQDVQRVERLRNEIGDDVWFVVRGAERYDVRTALSVARYLEEEIGVDWFEHLIAADDVAGHRRLASTLEVPLAGGSRLDHVPAFHDLCQSKGIGVLRPSVQRLGGLTGWLRVASLAAAWHKPVVPVGIPHLSVHLGCGLPGIHSVEWSAEWSPLLGELVGVEGKLAMPTQPGLGLEPIGDVSAWLQD